MANTFKVQLLTPEGPLYQGDVIRVTVPGSLGSFQIRYNHAPIVSSLGIGEIIITKSENDETHYAVSGGFVEMNSNQLTILAEKAEEASLIDIESARKLRDKLKSELQTRWQDREGAEVELKIAENRIKIGEL